MFKQIIAHRGESIECPESTIPSFEKAFELGADGIECDLQLTKDGVGVIFHDRTLEKKLGENTTISALRYSELRKRDFGSWKSSTWAGVTIANMEETLAMLPEGKVIHIEFKCGVEGIDVLSKAIETVKTSMSQIVLTSFQLDIGLACKRRYPDTPFLLNGQEFDYDQIIQSGIDGVAAYYSHDIFNEVLARKLQYRMGNINTMSEIETVHQHGVEYIDTNDVRFVVKYCRNTKRDA
jgi:glycerophosphoryl diester phosphodiesterase